jgi:hypothetical protein
MKKWKAWLRPGAFSVLAVFWCACGVKDTDPEPASERSEIPVQRLREALAQAAPDAVVLANGGNVRAFGAPLATGDDADAAANNFVEERAGSLGVTPAELRRVDVVGRRRVANAAAKPIGLMYDRATGRYKFYLYRHQQVRDGVPVFDAELLTLVRNEGNNPVLWTSSTVKGMGSFRARSGVRMATNRSKTLRGLRGLKDAAGRQVGAAATIANLTAPEAVVFAGAEGAATLPRMAMTYTTETQSPPGKWLVVASSDTGDVLHAESLVQFEDVAGTVAGNVTVGAKAMDCDEEIATPMPLADVTLVGGATIAADSSGAFVLPNPGTTAVDVSSAIGGVYFDVNNLAGTNASITQSVVPPGPANFLHNPDNATDLTRAEANGYVNAMQVRDFLLNYLPDYPTISTQLNFPVNVNRSDLYCPGNAWYDGSSINFCVGSATYGNTSFGSISYHEYGHHIVNTGGSGQGAYGEGMSDVVATLLAEDPGTGYGFYKDSCGAPLRTADNDCQYSATSCSDCGSEVHACGNLISGTIWSIRELLALSEPETHVDLINALVLSSIPMHSGTAIDSSIAADLLTLDDDDGILTNGTPHSAEICAGFEAHGMTCPIPPTGLAVTPNAGQAAEGPSGGPFAPESFAYEVSNLGPDGSLDYQVTVDVPWLQVSPASGVLDLGEVEQITAQVDQAAAALLPNGDNLATLSFEDTTSGSTKIRTFTLRAGIPQPIFSEDFESGLNGFAIDTGATNLWRLADDCVSTQPGHSTPSSLYFGTTSCNYDGGTVTGTITSPPVEVSDTSLVLLRLKYYLSTEGAGSFDRASVQVAVDGGAFSTVASSFGTGVALSVSSSGWKDLEVDLTSLLSGQSSATVQLRFGFDSIDSLYNTYAGFLVDDVEVRANVGSCETNADCDDGLSCSGEEACVDGVCVSGMPVSCDDSIACTIDSCDELTSCENVPDDTACADTTVCNGVETCDPLSGCVAGTPLDCDDGDLCTLDDCDPMSGCASTPVDCDDGDACTVDSCEPVLGCASTVLDCDDGNECTVDSCDLSGGCSSLPISGSCGDDGDSCTDDICGNGVCTHPDNGSCGAQPFVESAGMVVMEAESFHDNIPRANHTWTVVSNGSASGGELLRSDPNNGTNINTGYVNGSPELRFDVNFTTTGTYNVWVRGIGPNADADSCHVGIDGMGPGSSDRISSFGTSLSWSRSTMDGNTATINVSAPGVHTISLWMREDGFSFDKLVLTTSGSFSPSGTGPAESPQGQPEPDCAVDADCNDASACTNDACVGGFCQNVPVPNGTTCADDGNVCTNDQCNDGVCSHPNNTAPCADDGDSCTNDVCGGGSCTHPDNGSCQSAGPCAAYCSNPTTFGGGNYNSGNLGTGATCHETTGNINGGVCGNLAGGRTLSVNGQQMNCNGAGWSSLPAKVNGGYCVRATPGNYAWAYFVTW